MGFFSFLFGKKKYIKEADSKNACNKIQGTSKLEPSHSLMESHKVLIAAIKQMENAQDKTAAELLEKVAKRLGNEKEVWNFHRMRNRAAHEVDFQISTEHAKKARSAFKKALKSLTKS